MGTTGLYSGTNDLLRKPEVNIVIAIGTIILSYLIGSIPFGLLTVKWRTGIDIRHTGSGRIGGANAMRTAGYPIGVLTLILDVLRGALAV